MIAEINEHGILNLRPSSPLEVFAAKAWIESYINNSGCTLEIMSLDGSVLNGLSPVKESIAVLRQNDHAPEGLEELARKKIDESLSKLNESDSIEEIDVIEEVLTNLHGTPIKRKYTHGIDVNKDRKSKNGLIDILGDSKVLDFMSTQKTKLRPCDIKKGLEKAHGLSLHISNIYASLNRLESNNLLFEVHDSKAKYFQYGSAVNIVDELSNQVQSRGSVKEFKKATIHDRMEFAKSLGYKTIAEAIEKNGSWDFEEKVNQWMNN